MTKNHGFNLVILFVWMMLTLGGLGNAAFKYDGIYWVPFIVNAVIAVALGIKEFKGVNNQIGAKDETAPGKRRDPKTGRYIKSDGGKAK